MRPHPPTMDIGVGGGEHRPMTDAPLTETTPSAQAALDAIVPDARPVPQPIDARGPRVFAAGTAVLLVGVLVLRPGAPALATALLAAVAVTFLLAATLGPRTTPQGQLFVLVRRRLGPPAELEDPRPPRFAQLVGLTITGVGALLGAAGVDGAVLAAGVLALVAALLNAVVGLCLGCEMYVLTQRLRRG